MVLHSRVLRGSIIPIVALAGLLALTNIASASLVLTDRAGGEPDRASVAEQVADVPQPQQQVVEQSAKSKQDAGRRHDVKEQTVKARRHERKYHVSRVHRWYYGGGDYCHRARAFW